jgi:hypothetical protein
MDNSYLPLSYYQLAKRGGFRFSILHNKIENNEEFYTTKGNEILFYATSSHSLLFENILLNEIRQISPSINNHVLFLDIKGEKYTFKHIYKNHEFGGKGKGSGTAIEDYNLKLLNDNIQKLNKIQGDIDIKVGNTIYKSIIKAKTQKGFPKSDFNLIDKDGKEVVFISHKKANKTPSAKDFIRWSGFTDYNHHPDVKLFNYNIINHLIMHNLTGIPRKSKLIFPIKDDLLIKKLIYGKNYGDTFEKDNVTIICQGLIELVHINKNLYELKSQHTLYNGDIPEGDYYPYLTSTYRKDRKMFGINNNEAICSTKSVSFSASNVYLLENNAFKTIKNAQNNIKRESI